MSRVTRIVHPVLRTWSQAMAITYSTKIVPNYSHRPGPKAITSSKATIRPIVTCPANNENSWKSKGIVSFTHSGENKYATGDDDSVTLNVSHNVMHDSEFNGVEQKEFQDIGA